jgi:hypothetical protein
MGHSISCSQQPRISQPQAARLFALRIFTFVLNGGEAQPYFAIATRAAILLCRPNGSRTALFAHHTIWLSDVVLRDKSDDDLSFTLLNSSLSIFEFIMANEDQKSQWLKH